MNILITGIGGPTPRSIAKQIKKNYPKAKIVGVDCNHKALGFYMEKMTDRSYVVPKVNANNYWDSIQQIIDCESIDFAIVQPEMEVLEWGKMYKEKGFNVCPALIPPYEYTLNLMDKAKMADLLEDTNYIPRTLRISPQNSKISMIEEYIGFPCWVRASVGSGGFGSLKINRKEDLEAWLFIHKDIPEFTISEFLPGRHLANQMLYINGDCVRNAGLHCVEYVMANVAPSRVTGNTSYGKFINEEKLLEFCEEVMDYISLQLCIKPHGVFSFDLKEDEGGNLKVTEINIRHMAYTGIMSEMGFDLIGDTIDHHNNKTIAKEKFYYKENFVFLRDVDAEPVVMHERDFLSMGINHNNMVADVHQFLKRIAI